MNVRECKLCHRMVDFDEPWCDHETMEESGWLDIIDRQKSAIAVAKGMDDSALDALIEQTAIELGYKAGDAYHKLWEKIFDHDNTGLEDHLSNLDHVYQHRSQK